MLCPTGQSNEKPHFKRELSGGSMSLSAYKDFTKSPFCILHRVSIMHFVWRKQNERILFFIDAHVGRRCRDAHEDGSEERRGLTVFRIFDKIRKVLDDQYDSSRRRLCRY